MACPNHSEQLWSPEELDWVTSTLGPVDIIENLSWDLQGLLVIRVCHENGQSVVKTGRAGWRAPTLSTREPVSPSYTPHPHMVREVRAYERWIDPEAGYAPGLVRSNARLGALVIEHLHGEIAQRSSASADPETWRLAGAATRAFNRQVRAANSSFDGGNRTKLSQQIRHWREGRLYQPRTDDAAKTIEQLTRSAELFASGFSPEVLPLVATHADNSPRNWFVLENGGFRLIDFGRAGIRPWYVELEHVLGASEVLRSAFATGYGRSLDLSTWPPGERRSFALYSAVGFLGGLEWAQAHGETAFEEEILRRSEWISPLLADR